MTDEDETKTGLWAFKKEEMETDLGPFIKEELDEWTVDQRSSPTYQFCLSEPFSLPSTKLETKEEKIHLDGLGTERAPEISKTPCTTETPAPAARDSRPGTSRGRKALRMCAACGKDTSVLGHFVHKNKIFCQSTSDGVTLEEWMLDNVPRTTRWRWKVQQESIDAGITLPRKEHHTCSMCNKRMTRETGHSIHKPTRQAFCQATDPFGRTVEEWLTEIRGGVSTKDFMKTNHRKRQMRYRHKPEVREREKIKRRERYLKDKRRKEHEREEEKKKKKK
ncbi:uncharacterized protein LOC121950146 [Plectropomus leopardus]|uniref:uncharacterized protein LOC121950146 n=1 Tax=Plectropomus leopardus TaxID=160734 RepID=UPI001C4B8235|nr:uncharacterized protein LOC121950146 [Plectropomus leopardus]